MGLIHSSCCYIFDIKITNVWGFLSWPQLRNSYWHLNFCRAETARDFLAQLLRSTCNDCSWHWSEKLLLSRCWDRLLWHSPTLMGKWTSIHDVFYCYIYVITEKCFNNKLPLPSRSTPPPPYLSPSSSGVLGIYYFPVPLQSPPGVSRYGGTVSRSPGSEPSSPVSPLRVSLEGFLGFDRALALDQDNRSKQLFM